MKDMVRSGVMRRPRRLLVRLMRVGGFTTGKGAGEDRRFRIGLPRTRRSGGTGGARNGDPILGRSNSGERSRGLLRRSPRTHLILTPYSRGSSAKAAWQRQGDLRVPLSRQDSHLSMTEFDAIVTDTTSNHSHILMITDCLLTHVSSHMITW